jgi:hypothetical protein
MQTSTKVFAVIALSLFVVAGWGWHGGRVREQMNKSVLEKPIRFEEGFSFTSTFTVAYANDYYWIEVVCPRTNSSRSLFEELRSTLSRQLPIKFTITCDGKTVAEGDSPGIKSITGSAAEETRIMAYFKGETGKSYILSFRTAGVIPALDATNPRVRIRCPVYFVWPIFPKIYPITMLLYNTKFIAVAGLLFAISPCSFFLRKLLRHSQTPLNRITGGD